MAGVVVEITMSLDGYIAGPDVNQDQGLGKGGERLHNWIFDGATEVEKAILAEMSQYGAVIIGGHTYHTAIDKGWNWENPFAAPSFVVTHRPPERRVDGFTYITDGIDSAIAQAQATAGEKPVLVMGGANIIQQVIAGGYMDKLILHVVNVLIGGGTVLFGTLPQHIELTRTRMVTSPDVTHLWFDVVK